MAEESDDSPELSTPGVVAGVSLVSGVLVSMASTLLAFEALARVAID